MQNGKYSPMMISWRGVFHRHSRILGVGFAVYWLAMFLATHLEFPQVESVPKNSDKLVHLVMYGGLAFLLSLWLSTRTAWNRKVALCVFGACLVYAGLDELLQIPLASRSAEVWDFVMDLLGALLGLLLFAGFRAKCGGLWKTDQQTA